MTWENLHQVMVSCTLGKGEGLWDSPDSGLVISKTRSGTVLVHR